MQHDGERRCLLINGQMIEQVFCRKCRSLRRKIMSSHTVKYTGALPTCDFGRFMAHTKILSHGVRHGDK